MWIPTASRKCSTIPEFTSLQERIRSTCVETFTTENDDGREANGPAVGVDVRWTVRDQPHLKCNRHLEWDDTGRLRVPEGRSLAWRADAECCLLEKKCPHRSSLEGGI